MHTSRNSWVESIGVANKMKYLPIFYDIDGCSLRRLHVHVYSRSGDFMLMTTTDKTDCFIP